MRQRIFSYYKKGLPQKLRILSVVAVLMAGVGLLGVMANPAEAFPQPGMLYGVNSSDDGLSSIDPIVGEVTFIGPLDPEPKLTTTPVAMAVRPSDGEIFVWNNSDGTCSDISGTGVLLTVDPLSGLESRVNPATPYQGNLQALAFAPDERLFGLDSDLWEIDSATGEKHFVARLGLRIGGADFDAGGTLYGVELSRPSSRLVTVDTDTGIVATVAELTEDIGIIGSIVFAPDGTMIGSGFGGPLGYILFEIDPADGTVFNIRNIIGGFPPQGMGFAPSDPMVAVPYRTLSIDIKPGSCKNPLNVRSKGVTPLVIPGTEDFDVSDIDSTSIRLMGVAPVRSSLKDVAAPSAPSVEEQYSDDCDGYGLDGFEDLLLKFDTQQIVQALGGVEDGQRMILTLVGTLTDGTEIEGEDVVTIIKNGKK